LLFRTIDPGEIFGKKLSDTLIEALQIAALQSDADERRENTFGGGL
jgi:hypothetical protein